jgi:hypothetical protein
MVGRKGLVNMKKLMLPKLIMKWEKWKWNEEYGIFVSNFGHFRDKDKEDIPIKIIDTTGYVFVRTKYGARPAHRLVMLTWKPIPDRESFTVDHLDHNKRNNAVDNLEWVTAYENVERAKADTVKVKEVVKGNQQVISAIDIQKNQEHLFTSLEEAVKFLALKHKCNNSKSKKTLTKNITKALEGDGKYGNCEWKYI